MICIPDSGGCERPFTDAFVSHLNREFGSSYRHKACLDHSNSSEAQPEALYEDYLVQEKSLVTERKSICWPLDFSHRHSNDHLLANLIARDLGTLLADDLYQLNCPELIR